MTPDMLQKVTNLLRNIAFKAQHEGNYLLAAECWTELASKNQSNDLGPIFHAYAQACLNTIQQDIDTIPHEPANKV